MPSKFDPFLPPTRLVLPHGDVLSVGTVRCDDQIHQAVYLGFTPVGSTTPLMELELPPKSVEVLIRQLQEKANEARYINGTSMMEYPEPYPARPAWPRSRPQKRKPAKKVNRPTNRSAERRGHQRSRARRCLIPVCAQLESKVE